MRLLFLFVFCFGYVQSLSLKPIRIKVACALFTATTTLGLGMNPIACNAALDLTRFKTALSELQDLDKNFDSITDGDAVRRSLGTVYKPPKCDLALCNFAPYLENFIKANYDELDNLDEIDEPLKALATALQQADFLAYSSNFADAAGGGGSTAQKYLAKSRFQIKLSEELLQNLLKQL